MRSSFAVFAHCLFGKLILQGAQASRHRGVQNTNRWRWGPLSNLCAGGVGGLCFQPKTPQAWQLVFDRFPLSWVCCSVVHQHRGHARQGERVVVCGMTQHGHEARREQGRKVARTRLADSRWSCHQAFWISNKCVWSYRFLKSLCVSSFGLTSKHPKLN